MISLAAVVRAVVGMFDGLGVPVSATPILTAPVTGQLIVVDGPSLTPELQTSGCGYVEASVTVTAIAAGTDAQHFADLLVLVDRLLAVMETNAVRPPLVVPSVWQQSDHPVRPSYEITFETTTMEA